MKFTQLSLPNTMVENLNQLGFTELRSIQELSLPTILDHHDTVIKAPTASGKTLIFAIAALLSVDTYNPLPQALILVPTRELAMQVAHEIRSIGKYHANLKVTTLVGGEPLEAQSEALRSKTHIIVATVGRFQDHLGRLNIELESIKVLVLDEADKMLEMGFREDIINIAQKLPPSRQNLLCSATLPEKLNHLIEQISTKPVLIESELSHQSIRSLAYSTQNKEQTLMQLLSHFQATSTLIFANTKLEVERLCSALQRQHFEAQAFHGDLVQKRREELIAGFKNGSIVILVATDIVSRGIDIDGIELVINYDIADKAQIHTHRMGRGGRDGSQSTVITLYAPYEKNKLLDIVGDVEEANPIETPITPYGSAKKSWIIHGGKRDKLRKGDIVGALCQSIGVEGNQIGAIEIQEDRTFVALAKEIVIQEAKIKIKKRNFKLYPC